MSAGRQIVERLPHEGPTMLGADWPTASSTLCATLVEHLGRAYRASLRAIVLAGSVARGEGTFIQVNGGSKLLGDAEFFLIFRDATCLPCGGAIQSLREKIESNLQEMGLDARLDLKPVAPKFLQRLRPHILAYELRERGKVIWGDKQVLSLIPKFSAEDIPLEDAWRLLANRMVEQLEYGAEFAARGSRLSLGLAYRTVKLYLDMATSLLVFAGAYRPSYVDRQRELEQLAAQDNSEAWPFPLGEFAKQVAVCTEWKLGARPAENSDSWEFWDGAMLFARKLWRWELERMLRADKGQTEEALMAQWVATPSAATRLRGWLYLLRACGWHWSWRNRLRWFRQVLKTTPRYEVYAVASALLFGLLDADESDRREVLGKPSWFALLDKLPLVDGTQADGCRSPWEYAAGAELENYKRFLVNTRS